MFTIYRNASAVSSPPKPSSSQSTFSTSSGRLGSCCRFGRPQHIVMPPIPIRTRSSQQIIAIIVRREKSFKNGLGNDVQVHSERNATLSDRSLAPSANRLPLCLSHFVVHFVLPYLKIDQVLSVSPTPRYTRRPDIAPPPLSDKTPSHFVWH